MCRERRRRRRAARSFCFVGSGREVRGGDDDDDDDDGSGFVELKRFVAFAVIEDPRCEDCSPEESSASWKRESAESRQVSKDVRALVLRSAVEEVGKIWMMWARRVAIDAERRSKRS